MTTVDRAGVAGVAPAGEAVRRTGRGVARAGIAIVGIGLRLAPVERQRLARAPHALEPGGVGAPQARIVLGLVGPGGERCGERRRVAAVEQEPQEARPRCRRAGVERQRAAEVSLRIGDAPAPAVEPAAQQPVDRGAREALLVARGLAAEPHQLVPPARARRLVHREEQQARLAEPDPALASVADRVPGPAGLAAEHDEPLGADRIDRAVLPHHAVGALGQVIGFLLPRQLGEQLPVLGFAVAGRIAIAPAAELGQRRVGLAGGPLQLREADRAREAGPEPPRQLAARGDTGTGRP